MKKKVFAIITAICTLAALCALSACDKEKQGVKQASGNIDIIVQSVVFTASSDVMTLTDSTSLADYMDVLAEDGELVFDAENGEYGYYIVSIYATKAEGNAYWALYTDLVTIEGDDAVYSNAEYGTYEYDGKTLYSASYGASGLPCIDGYTYAWVYTTY